MEHKIRLLCLLYGIDPDQLFSSSKHPHIVDIRFIINYCLRTKGWTTFEIGKLLRRNPSTLTNAIKKFHAYAEFDQVFRMKALKMSAILL